MFLQDSSPDKNAVFMSAPHSFHLDAEQMDRTRCFVSLRKVGLSVATFPGPAILPKLDVLLEFWM